MGLPAFQENLLCFRCRVPLELSTVSFIYLRHIFSAEVPRCPQCAQVYISEDLVQSRVAAVERSLEDK